MLMSEASTTESTSACDLLESLETIFDGDRLYFDHQVRMRQASYLDGRAGRKRDAQIIMPNIDVSKELVDIGHKCCGFDKISETCSRGFERRAEILSTWRICTRILRGPTIFPDLSRASCPEIKMSDCVSATT